MKGLAEMRKTETPSYWQDFFCVFAYMGSGWNVIGIYYKKNK